MEAFTSEVTDDPFAPVYIPPRELSELFSELQRVYRSAGAPDRFYNAVQNMNTRLMSGEREAGLALVMSALIDQIRSDQHAIR